MTTFGHLLRLYRRQCSDPLRGGTLTQSRLGELIGDEIGHAGYSGAAVSDWERDKSKIHADDRLVLVALLAVLYECGGLPSPADANTFLAAGNYRALDEAELAHIFPDKVTPVAAIGGRQGDTVAPAPPLTSSPPHPAMSSSPMSSSPMSSLPMPPSPSPSPRDVLIAHLLTDRRRKELILLDKVENFWVNGVLEKAVRETALLDVAWERCDTAVSHPWQNILDTVQPTANDIPGIFFATDRALLILGAPGSGKTITLITLARHLIARARTDASQPIPVILNLASWAENRPPLANWIVAELTAKYQVPRNLGRDWLADDDLILLLDGLDEVNSHHQAACIQAINQFRQTNGLAGIVVCSRLDDYQGIHVPLKLSGAIRLQPLSPVQIEEYLTAVNVPLNRARHAITRDPILGEMVQSPLMLRVLSDSYRPDTAVNTAPSTDSDTRRRQVFATYVNQALARRGALSHPPEQTSHWLAWLARKMEQHNQTVFLLEQLQPSWLPRPGQQRAFILTSRLLDGFSLGAVLSMFWLLVRLSLPQFDTVWSTAVTDAWRIPLLPLSLTLFLLISLLLGLVVGLTDIAFYERRARLGEAFVARRRDEWGQTAVVVLVVSLASLAFVGLYRSPLIGLASSLFTGITFAIISFFIHGTRYRSDIRPIEVLSWSWSGALVGLGFGLLAGAVFELVEYQVVGSNPIFRTVFSITLLATLLGGLRGNRLPTTSAPNQGLWLSASSGLAAAGLFAIVMSLTTAFFWTGPFGALVGVLVAWIAAALYGMGSVLNHLWLRFWLVQLGHMPWAYSDFLDEAAGRAILHKVGGGYIFIHRLLQEYFAGLDSPGRK